MNMESMLHCCHETCDQYVSLQEQRPVWTADSSLKEYGMFMSCKWQKVLFVSHPPGELWQPTALDCFDRPVVTLLLAVNSAASW